MHAICLQKSTLLFSFSKRTSNGIVKFKGFQVNVQRPRAWKRARRMPVVFLTLRATERNQEQASKKQRKR